MKLFAAEQYFDLRRIMIQRQGILEEKKKLVGIITGVEEKK